MTKNSSKTDLAESQQTVDATESITEDAKTETEVDDKWIPLRRAFHLQLPRELGQFVKQSNSKYFHIDQDAKRLRCTLTGHEFMAKGDALNNYLSSKKFKKALNNKTDWASLSAYLVQHPKYPDKFLCTLTNTPLTKNKINVIKHVQSERYKNALDKKLVEEEEKKKEAEQTKKQEDQENENEQVDKNSSEPDSGVSPKASKQTKKVSFSKNSTDNK